MLRFLEQRVRVLLLSSSGQVRDRARLPDYRQTGSDLIPLLGSLCAMRFPADIIHSTIRSMASCRDPTAVIATLEVFRSPAVRPYVRPGDVLPIAIHTTGQDEAVVLSVAMAIAAHDVVLPEALTEANATPSDCPRRALLLAAACAMGGVSVVMPTADRVVVTVTDAVFLAEAFATTRLAVTPCVVSGPVPEDPLLVLRLLGWLTRLPAAWQGSLFAASALECVCRSVHLAGWGEGELTQLATSLSHAQLPPSEDKIDVFLACGVLLAHSVGGAYAILRGSGSLVRRGEMAEAAMVLPTAVAALDPHRALAAVSTFPVGAYRRSVTLALLPMCTSITTGAGWLLGAAVVPEARAACGEIVALHRAAIVAHLEACDWPGTVAWMRFFTVVDDEPMLRRCMERTASFGLYRCDSWDNATYTHVLRAASVCCPPPLQHALTRSFTSRYTKMPSALLVTSLALLCGLPDRGNNAPFMDWVHHTIMSSRAIVAGLDPPLLATLLTAWSHTRHEEPLPPSIIHYVTTTRTSVGTPRDTATTLLALSRLQRVPSYGPLAHAAVAFAPLMNTRDLSHVLTALARIPPAEALPDRWPSLIARCVEILPTLDGRAITAACTLILRGGGDAPELAVFLRAVEARCEASYIQDPVAHAAVFRAMSMVGLY